jgi:hypothetical protein
MPLVSVIITCYNQAHFLSQSIESVISQTQQNLEIIVVDDDSKDNPEEVVSRYPTVRFIRQTNQGVAAARNRGLQESSGRFVIFLDADDRLLPEALQSGLESFQARPDCGFVLGEGRSIDAEGQALPIPMVQYQDGGYLELLRQNTIGFPAVVMYDRAALQSIGGFRSFVDGTFIGNTADYDLNLRIASRYPIHCHRKLVAEWRQHPTNTSRKVAMMTESVLMVLQSQRDFVSGNETLEQTWKQAMKNWRRDYMAETRVDRLRTNARDGRWLSIPGDALWLLFFEPRVLLENLRRKAKVELSKKH